MNMHVNILQTLMFSSSQNNNLDKGGGGWGQRESLLCLYCEMPNVSKENCDGPMKVVPFHNQKQKLWVHSQLINKKDEYTSIPICTLEIK